MRRLCFLLACLAPVGVAPAAAIPPPPEVAVLVLSPGDEAPRPVDESDDLLAAISPADGGGWLRIVEPAFTYADFAACTASGVAEEGCVRQVLAARGAAGVAPPTVVVLVGPGPGFTLGWRCVGIGETPASPERQNVSMDTMLWRAASPNAWDRDRPTAVGCVLAAAAESGW